MTYHNLFINDLESKKREGVCLVNVREYEEDAAGHTPGAKNLPSSEVQGLDDELGPSTVLICASGNRSTQSAYPASQDTTGLLNLSGGAVA